MTPRAGATAILVLLACGIEVHASFLGSTPHFVGVDLRSSSDPHGDGHHGHDDHGHDDHGHDDQVHAHGGHGHDDHGHGSAHDEHHGHETESGHGSAHDEHHGHVPATKSASSVAMGLMAWVILTPVLMSMLMTQVAGGQVSYLTFRMIDMGTSIFLAVLWFSAFGDILHRAIPYADATVIGVLVLVLYVGAMSIAYTLRENKFSLFVFLGISAHFIAFAAIKAATEAQQNSGRLGGGAAMSFGFCVLLFGVFAAISLVCFYSWRRYTKSEELQIAIDELELDVAGLVLSFTIMQALRHALSGHYPSPAHLFLQSSPSLAPSALRSIAGGHGHATERQKSEMLMWSIGFTVLACVALFTLNTLKDRTHYWCHKLLHVVEVVLVMCAAWGYLLWGAWQFTETDFSGDPMFGNMIFAVFATIISFIVIVVAAFAIDKEYLVKGYARLCIMAISLVTAWSWEHCFHVAVNIVAAEYSFTQGGLITKVIIAIIVPLTTLPGYIAFLKPIVLEKTEKFDADEEEAEHKDLAEVMCADAATSPTKPSELQSSSQG